MWTAEKKGKKETKSTTKATATTIKLKYIAKHNTGKDSKALEFYYRNESIAHAIIYKMVNAKSEYFIAQSVRLYWHLDSVARLSPLFFLSLLVHLVWRKKMTDQMRSSLKNSCG